MTVILPPRGPAGQCRGAGQAVERFADDFKLSFDAASQQGVIAIIFYRPASGELRDQFSGLTN
jgi:hypothetical protein